MRIVVALGGNALLRRGQPMTAEAQRENVRVAAEALAPLARVHELVVSHGNGPQVGLLALQGAAYKEVDAYPLDVLGAETEGMIGYMIEQELLNVLGSDVRIATLLTMIEVDPGDEAFRDPTKFIGPVYPKDQAERLAAEKGWAVRQDGDAWRRVVPSPRPVRIVELAALDLLVSGGILVICAGGGGIPVARDETGRHVGVEAVIDKDFASELLARHLKADLFIMATDVPGVFVDWGRPDQRLIRQASPGHLEGLALPAGSMGPKVEAACHFVRATGGEAAIGALGDLPEIVAGRSGTRVTASASQIRYVDTA